MKVAFAIAVLALCVLSVSAGCPGADSWKKVLSKAAAGKFMFVEVDNSIELVSTDALTLAAERAKKPAPVGSKKPTAPPSSKKPSTGSSSKSGSTADKPGKISFEPHVSGKKDSATSKQNVVDASNGVEVSRSSYQNAPGGKVCMAEKVAQLLLKLLEKGDVRISELAGGSHSATSGHYAGNSVDITSFKGEYLTKSAKNVKAVIDTCKSLGSTAIYHASLGKDKTNAEHKTHVHCQFGPNFKPEKKKAGSSSSSSKPSSKKPAPNRAKKPRAKK